MGRPPLTFKRLRLWTNAETPWRRHPVGTGGMPLHARVFLLLVTALVLAGCSSDGVGKGNFELTPQRIGWYAGDNATFTLELKSSLTRSDPSFTIDRRFAIEEIQLNEKGLRFGGDYDTRNPDDVNLRLMRDNVTADEFVLDSENRSIEIVLTLPEELRDSEYALELKLFDVGWIKSETFRVDKR